jgi:two-component system, chemotaxis family, chemotaxis protein CheY
MPRILIVDDSRTSRKILRVLLEQNGYDVVAEAENGEEGFLKYKKYKPDVVTMDITMPVLSGLESLALIKHEDASAKVIMVTAAGQKDKMITAVRYGAAEFITKPYEESAILKVLSNVGRLNS